MGQPYSQLFSPEMLALFSILIDEGGEVSTEYGSLHNIPPELRTKHLLDIYSKTSKMGWNRSQFGYYLYATRIEPGKVLIIPGLYLTDTEKPNKIFSEYRPIYNKKQIENYIKSHIQRNEKIREDTESQMTTLIHDLRHLSSAIYHSAEELDRNLRSNDKRLAIEGVKSVISSQTMLKVRIDYLDYQNSSDRFAEYDDIPIYRRVDKVTRCFRAMADSKNISLELLGSSFRTAYGPNVLDIVPYILVDNAIKYSPRGRSISVSVFDTTSETKLVVSSLGPMMSEEETTKIFERGFRGSQAQAHHSSGTGLGLFVAQQIVSDFGGGIQVTIDSEPLTIGGKNFVQVSFTVALPSSDPNR